MVLAVVGLTSYSLWRNRLFWVLMLVSFWRLMIAGAFALLARSQHRIIVGPDDVGITVPGAVLSAPVLAVPSWLLVTAVSWWARSSTARWLRWQQP